MNDYRLITAANNLLALTLATPATRDGLQLADALAALRGAVTEATAPQPDKNEAARNHAKAQLASIIEMVAALECDYDRIEELRDELTELTEAVTDATTKKERKEAAAAALEAWKEENQEELDALIAEAGDCTDADDARRRIEEDALSVQVRSDWHSPGETAEDTEFEILLCTGGPACKIVGELGQYNEPDRAWIEFQDWFTSWGELVTTGEDNRALLAYCRVFYFGE